MRPKRLCLVPELWNSDGQFAKSKFSYSLKFSFDAVVCSFQALREHACFPDYAHEIGVSYPAGKNMHVYMGGNAGSGGLSQVHAQIQAVRVVELTQDSIKPLG
jgi:hypothetical protein